MTNGRDWLDLSALIVFLLFLVAAIRIIDVRGDILTLLQFSFFDLLVVSLASFRLLHLLTYDKVFAFVRNYFDSRGKAQNSAGLHRYIDSFLECIWCTGMWSGLVMVTIYLLGMWGQFIVYVFAAAGVASLLQLTSLAFSKRVD